MALDALHSGLMTFMAEHNGEIDSAFQSCQQIVRLLLTPPQSGIGPKGWQREDSVIPST